MSFKIRRQLVKIYNLFRFSETIENSKIKWNRLANKNARYYVLSNQGENISEEEFRETGLKDYQDLIESDDFLFKKIGNFKDKSVLEIGCGLGRVTEFLAKNFKEVVGIDISEIMIREAKERLSNFSNVNLVVNDGLTYPLESNRFDFVFSYIVFQHMANEEVVKNNFHEIYRVLKLGGVAKIQLRGLPVKRDDWFYGPSFNRKDLPNLLEGLNFNILRDEGEGEKLYWITLEKK